MANTAATNPLRQSAPVICKSKAKSKSTAIVCSNTLVKDVAVVTAPEDYAAILEEMRASGGELSRDTKWRLAKKVFRTTADYDSAISARLEQVEAQVAAAAPLPCS